MIPQKNLIHAVDAVLASLDPLAHKIETGTVMLFAKEDMGAAALGLEDDDIEEALDAQSFVVESLQGLRAKIDKVTPEYRYIRRGRGIHVRGRAAKRGDPDMKMRQSAGSGRRGAPDAVVVEKESRAIIWQRPATKLTGEERYADTASPLG